MSYKSEIIELNKHRFKLIEKINNDAISKKIEEELNKEIDKLGEEIINIIKQFSDDLEFEFIMEELSHLGQCPCLLNDDNGHWAISSDGYQTVVTGEPQDVETHFFVEAKQWKNTSREALIQYLSDDEDNEEK